MASNVAAAKAWAEVKEAKKRAKDAGATYVAANEAYAEAKRLYENAVRTGWK